MRILQPKLHKLSTALLPVMVVAICASFLLFPPRAKADPAAGVTIVVNSTGDTADANPGDGVCDTGGTVGGDPECTLAAAIITTNLNGNPTLRDVINFDIPGSGVQTIQPAAHYGITNSVLIDGYTQTGAAENTAVSPSPFNGSLMIEIDGTSLGAIDGIFNISAGDSTVIRGLVMNRSAREKVYVGTVDNVQLYGNYFGTDPTGMIAQPVASDDLPPIIIGQGSTAAHIGGVLPGQRNIVSGNTGGSIYVGGPATHPSGGFIQGNYVGVAADGVTTLANKYGISLDDGTHDYTVGGDAAAARNVVENNLSSGITLQSGSFSNSIINNRIVANVNHGVFATSASDSVIRGNVIGENHEAGIYVEGSTATVITGNYIGVLEDGTSAFGNTQDGVYVYNNPDGAIVGGTDDADANTIAHNGGKGVAVAGTSQGVSILRNTIFSNTALGIDLGSTGVTNNDTNDPDAGSNNLLNFPQGVYASESAGNTSITYRLDVPAGSYRVEMFSNTAADGSGFGEGQTWLGSQNVTSTGSGFQYSTKVVSGTGHTNLSYTATLIDGTSATGFGPTSEFGNNVLTTDLAATLSVDNPMSVTQGSVINYTLTLTNNGYQDIDIDQFNGAGGNPFATDIFTGILPPDVAFGSVATSYVSCTPYGPGSASFTPFLGNHNDYELVACGYIGPSHVLHMGEHFTINFSGAVSQTSDLTFTAYALTGLLADDPDASTIFSSFGTADSIDTLTTSMTNNLASASYPVPVQPGGNVSQGGGAPGQASSGQAHSEGLTGTGQNQMVAIFAALALLAIAVIIASRSRKAVNK